MAMHTRLLDSEITYTGAQLRSGWIAQQTGLTGDAAVAFLGPCDVEPEHMVDMVDLQAGARIYSPRMVHIIIEHPGLDLMHITLRQRLLMAIAGELINAHLGETLLRRDGDDLYLRDRKLSVSVATVGTAGPGTAGFSLPSSDPGTAGFSLPSPSPAGSGLIHSGFNVRGEGAPVPAIGLEELGLDPRAFAEHLLAAYARELETSEAAAAKVKRVT
jgi:hypothetical protein